METRIIIAGSGGQGIMFLGKVLAETALLEGKNVTYLPAYGAEVRGGTANCTIVISDEEIGSPCAETADIIVVMNEPSLARFKSKVKADNGMIIANSSLIKEIAGTQAFPFTRLAIDLGNAKGANMVALGCLAQKTGVVTVAGVLSALKSFGAKAEALELNKKAVQAGAGL